MVYPNGRVVHFGDVIAYSFMLTISGVTFALFSLNDEDNYYNKPSKIAVGTMGFFSLIALTNSGYQLYKTFTPARTLPESAAAIDNNENIWTSLFKGVAVLSTQAFQNMLTAYQEFTTHHLNNNLPFEEAKIDSAGDSPTFVEDF